MEKGVLGWTQQLVPINLHLQTSNVYHSMIDSCIYIIYTDHYVHIHTTHTCMYVHIWTSVAAATATQNKLYLVLEVGTESQEHLGVDLW